MKACRPSRVAAAVRPDETLVADRPREERLRRYADRVRAGLPLFDDAAEGLYLADRPRTENDA